MNKYYLKAFAFVALFAMCVALLPANAAGVDPTYAAPGPTDGEIDATEVASDGFATTTASWTSTEIYTSGTTITMAVTWSGTDVGAPSTSNLGACDVTSAFGVSGHYGTFSPTQATWIIDGGDVAASTLGQVCVRVPVENNGTLYEGNFALSVLTSNAAADFGALEYYVGGGNDVLVSGLVTATLEFAIVDQTNVALEQHVCELGTLLSTQTNSCYYRLRISTNAQNGFEVNVNTDHALGTGFATITEVVDNAAVVAGIENYGVYVTGASIGGRDSGTGNYDQPIVEVGTFASDATPITTSSNPVIVSFSDGFEGTTTQSTTLVEHRASISPVTPAGYYSQTVTYTITPDF